MCYAKRGEDAMYAIILARVRLELEELLVLSQTEDGGCEKVREAVEVAV